MAEIQYYIDNDTICSICYAEFLDIDDLKVHTIQYHLRNTNKNRFCKLCSIIFASIDDFALHIRNDHLSDLKSCKYCSKMYINVNLLLEHEKRHKNEGHYFKLCCSQCETSFDNKSDLENHEYDNHKESDDGIMLQHCFASLSGLINMNIRRFLEVSHRDCLYVCAICDMSTQECSLYIQHLKKSKCQSYACNDCYNVYTMKRALREHCGRHLRAKNFKCPKYKKQCLKCSKYYTTYDLKRHLKDCNIIKCRQCPLRFDSVSGLANHVTIHSQKIPAQFISCKYCRKPVIGMSALEKHIERTHKHNLHLYKYNCIYCDISFKHPKLLFGHFYTKHKDIQPYTCKICNKKFRLRKTFTLHIKLDHKSVGFVEFDDNFHVFFTDKKPTNNESNLKIKENFVNSLDLMKKSSPEEQDKVQTNMLDKATNEPKLLKNNEGLSEINTTTDIVEISRTESIKNIITIDNTEECENSSRHEYVFNCSLSEENKSKILEDIVERDDKRGSPEELVFENIEILEPEIIESDPDTRLIMVRKKRKYRKIRSKTSTNESKLNLDDSSDDSDIPLVKFVKENNEKIKERRKAPWNICPARVPKSKKFMCLKCNRNCYTYQNYDRHMNMHKKNKNKSCIKCVRQFKTTEDLVHHIKTEHATSRLTETLKKMLDQRRKDEHEIYISEKFVQTMQKVSVAKNISQATITRVNNRLSVKKFWENFTPDNDGKKDAQISIRQVSDKRAEPLIKLTKFNPEPPTRGPPKLKMPSKYTDSATEQNNVSIKLVYCDLAPSVLNFHNEITITDLNYNEIENQSNKDIPEIAHEIMLEETEVKNVKYIKKTVILKDLLRYNNVKIGHLAPQAPYFKIVSIDDVLQHTEGKAKEPVQPGKVVLPDGTKLVNVNPLAHLLNNKDIKEICKSTLKSKSTAKVQNFSEAIVKAMTLLDKPVKKSGRRVESVDPIEID